MATAVTPTYTPANILLGSAASLALRLLQALALVGLGFGLWWFGRFLYAEFQAGPKGAATPEATTLTRELPPRPAHYEPVTDAAGLLQPAEADSLRARLQRFERATATQLVLVTVASIGPEPVEDVAQRLYHSWGIGQRGTDNGLLLLLARHERKIRIQTGYGLEGAIPDAVAGRLIREVMQPAFQQGRYYAGLDAAITQLMRLARGESASFARATRPLPTFDESGAFGYWLLGLWGLLLWRQCRRHGGLVGLWAWTQGEWVGATQRTAGSSSGSASDSSGSSWSSSSSSSDSDSSSDWGGGDSGGGGASGDW